MVLSSANVSMTYSGGVSNTNPDFSLGGIASEYSISGNRLFDDVTETEATNGLVDYRCFYFNNDSDVDTLYSAQMLISYTVPGDVTAQIGFNFQNEIQNLTVSNYSSVTSGSFILTYTDINDDSNYNFTVDWNADLSTWASNFQTAIQALTNLGDVTVEPTLNGSVAVFNISFLGSAGNRYHNILTLHTNSLSPSESISITKIIDGSPINQIADIIDVSTTEPIGITFNAEIDTIGDIRPLDSVPIWVQRTVPVNSTPIENDGFTLQVQGFGLPSS